MNFAIDRYKTDVMVSKDRLEPIVAPSVLVAPVDVSLVKNHTQSTRPSGPLDRIAVEEGEREDPAQRADDARARDEECVQRCDELLTFRSSRWVRQCEGVCDVIDAEEDDVVDPAGGNTYQARRSVVDRSLRDWDRDVHERRHGAATSGQKELRKKEGREEEESPSLCEAVGPKERSMLPFCEPGRLKPDGASKF